MNIHRGRVVFPTVGGSIKDEHNVPACGYWNGAVGVLR